MIGNRDGNSFRKSQILRLDQSDLNCLPSHAFLMFSLQRLNRTSDVALHLKSFLLVLLAVLMENCFSFSLHSICFHGYQAFASEILLQGSPVHISFQKGPCCRKPEQYPAQALEDLCSDLFTAFKPWVLSEHKQSQRDIKNCLLRIVYTIPTHCSSSNSATHIFADFWLLCIKVVKRLSQVREMGREHVDPGKGWLILSGYHEIVFFSTFTGKNASGYLKQMGIT